MQPLESQPSGPDPNFRLVLEKLSNRGREAFHQYGVAPIAELVSEAPAEYQDRIFVELIIEEARLVRQRGGTPKFGEYGLRFPDRQQLVEQAWQKFERSDLEDTVDRQIDPSNSHSADFRGQDAVSKTPTYFGPYKVLRPLGSGTFGSVYKAEHESTGKVVAVKILKSQWARDTECGPHMRQQFADEATMMLKFDHPHIVKVISLDDGADPPYFVQEYIEGETLANRLQTARPSLDQTLQYAIQIADGLAHIHSRQRWHRDLKPANILLDRNNLVYLTDFGLAMDDAQRWSSSRGPAGTYQYMAPEQIKGATHRLNARCDIWAFGVILYEMLTGRRPFGGETFEQLCDEIIERTPAAPREQNRAIPRELNRLCMQCLSKKDADRPHAAADLQDDLAQILEQLSAGSSSALPSSTSPVATETADSTEPSQAVEYPIPTLKRFTAEQAELYLRLMPRSYATQDELPELIGYWKQRILEPDPDKTFVVGIMVGVSGCGKSSMLEAGLVPALPDSIIPILIEASESDTEVRILSKLRRVLPAAAPEKKWSLVDWAFRLRSGSLLPSSKKVVFVIDQFEQWLNAHGGESTNQLLDALHQCDGEHLQAIVCVREGFHSTLMRFVDSLEIVLDADENYATAHRFKPDHARFVLTQFGRGLKRLDAPISEAQQAFIDVTVDCLAESDRGVVCVRLVVLALVMQYRPWTVEELEKLGGLDGIGSQFLVDCFEGRTASEQYRRYLPAAIRVLAELLPAEGLEIKDVRSYDQLLAASELDKLQFDDLLNIFTRKLFLLTLVEVQRDGFSADNNQDRKSQEELTVCKPIVRVEHYQLTHDFLVPSIREWLARKLRETKEGRAQFRLQELSAAWKAKPENRNLPSLWEWFTICRLTDRKKWKPNEQTVMRSAKRVHTTRVGLLASAVAVLVAIGLGVQGQVLAQQKRTQVEGLVSQLKTAEPANLPSIIQQLDEIPDLAREFILPLVNLEPKTTEDRKTRLHAQLAMVEADVSLVDSLVEELLTNKVAYIGPIRELLTPYKTELTERLGATLRDSALETNRRFRAGVALSGYTKPGAFWDESDLQLLATQLVTSNAEYQPVLRDNLRPIAEQLLDPLKAVFKDASVSDAMRLGAANALVDLAADKAELLTRLLADATPAQYEVLFPLVETARSDAGVAAIERIAATLPADELGSVPRIAFGQRRANAAVSLLRLDEREKVLPVFNYTDDPEALTQFIFRCKPRGVGPQPLLELLDILTRRKSEELQTDISSVAFKQNALARHAILLALGQFTVNEIPTAKRDALIARLSDWYANDPSSGVHGASGWLLRQWGEHEIVRQVDQTSVPYSEDLEWFTLAITVQPTSPPKPKRETNESGEESETTADRDAPEAASVSEATGSDEPQEPSPAEAEVLPAKTFYYTFIVFPAGESKIGSVEDEQERLTDGSRELRHPVKLTRPFALLDREVTFDELIAFSPQYADFMNRFKANPNDAGFGPDWYDSVAFCRWLGAQAGYTESDQAYPIPDSLSEADYPREPDPDAKWAPRDWPLDLSRRGFRLPTEAEWEVATRSGTRTSYGYGSDVEHLGRFGWYQQNSGKRVHVPRQLLPSLRGLFDVHGNLLEWSHDWYSEFAPEMSVDPLGPPRALQRVVRGGGWDSDVANCRAASRNSPAPTGRTISVGFRLALSPSGVLSQVEPVAAGVAEPLGSGTEGVTVQRPEMP